MQWSTMHARALNLLDAILSKTAPHKSKLWNAICKPIEQVTHTYMRMRTSQTGCGVTW